MGRDGAGRCVMAPSGGRAPERDLKARYQGDRLCLSMRVAKWPSGGTHRPHCVRRLVIATLPNNSLNPTPRSQARASRVSSWSLASAPGKASATSRSSPVFGPLMRRIRTSSVGPFPQPWMPSASYVQDGSAWQHGPYSCSCLRGSTRYPRGFLTPWSKNASPTAASSGADWIGHFIRFPPALQHWSS